MRAFRATGLKVVFALLCRPKLVAAVLEVAWMVTGAAGRLLLLERVYGLPSGRATEDVDFGVMVESWAQYQALVQRICQDPRVRQDPKQRQRLRFSEVGYLDLVPFGGVESTAYVAQT
jgi:predicted nucleotidyltransferase